MDDARSDLPMVMQITKKEMNIYSIRNKRIENHRLKIKNGKKYCPATKRNEDEK